MTRHKRLRSSFSLVLLGVFAAASIGCGELTIRTWVNIVEEESDGLIEADYEPPYDSAPITRLQGGFQTVLELDTRDLPGALEGWLTLADVRVAAMEETLLGPFCNWNDPAGESGGPMTIDVLAGTSESDVFLDAKAQSLLSHMLNVPPIDIETPVEFELGEGVGIDTFLDALLTGSVDGAFASQSTMVTETEILEIPVTFTLNLSLDNGPKPPVIDGDLLSFCGQFFDEQGMALFHGVNSKSSYLRAYFFDQPADPLIISLADVGATPGDTLRLTAVGTYSAVTELKDGIETKVTGVFSATDTVLDRDQEHRVPDAIDAGVDIVTAFYLQCVGVICWPIPTDIPEDFQIDPEVDVVVPSGANYLIVAPLDWGLKWDDNSGLGFGIDIEVNPGA